MGGSQSDWLVTVESEGNRVKVTNVRTGQMICKFGSQVGGGEGQFYTPRGVAITPDSSFVIVADYGNHRVQVLRLVVAADGQSGHLEFVRSIGNGLGRAEGQLFHPVGVALLKDADGQHTVVVNEAYNHRVSQFALETGAFIRMFAGTGQRGSGDGEFSYPTSITVLSSSNEVAIVDECNNRVQIFDSEGQYLRQFGTYGGGDGQFKSPDTIASDAYDNMLVIDFSTGRLQLFNSKGEHMCTRSDLGLAIRSFSCIAWGTGGQLALGSTAGDCVLRAWHL